MLFRSVQVAGSTDRIDANLAALQSNLWRFGLIAAGVAAIVGAAIATRIARPVAELTEISEEITSTGRLDRQIETERDDEIGRLARSFNRMVRSLALSREQQHRLVQDASHELRTSLTSLRTNVEALRRAKSIDAGERDQLLGDINAELVELSELVGELVELATDQHTAEVAERVQLHEVIAAAAWLQGPGSENLPIMLEPETSSGYPRAQGFVQLVPSQNSWRLGLNFWANTDGQYLPDIFEMDPPPPSPPRRTRVPATSAGQPPTPTTGSEYPMQPSNSMMINAVPDVGKGLEGSANQSGEANGPPGQSDLEHGVEGDYTPPRPPEWPWRHVIHVADTVPLTENRLRYYDHPVIKVLAIWRELSWYELYVRGVARRDAERAAIDD